MDRRVIPTADQSWLDEFRGYMHQVDLFDASMDDAAYHFDAGATTLHKRLAEAGTSWKRELKAERQRRLERAAAGGATESGPYYAEVCGYQHPQSFFRAFNAWYGVNFTDWQKGCMAPTRAVAKPEAF